MRQVLVLVPLVLALLTFNSGQGAPPQKTLIGVNVVLNVDVSPAILSQLALYGKVRDVVYEISALTLQCPASNLALIQDLPFVAAANPDAERTGAPVDSVPETDFTGGYSTWNLDMINVTQSPGFNDRQTTVAYDGTGVYVAVLDTGLLDSWRQYFPQERIAVPYAKCFGGGGGNQANVSEQPNKWEHDQNSHGTHVTSTILGYSLGGEGFFADGVAPMATVIPVKVLNQNGRGWSSVIARGIAYVADLKAGPLADYPVVINLSLGGSLLDAMEKAAIDYAIRKGVIIVASAGNRGTAGMGYPGAYAPVISVGAAGWVDEWQAWDWWITWDVADPSSADDVYIADFSSRALAGQDLDVLAPGSWVLGPYQVNGGQISYFFLGGTSMASPHVAGVVALMLQKNPSLVAADAETILETTALAIAPSPQGGVYVLDPWGSEIPYEWDSEATGSGLVQADGALSAVP